MPTIVPFALVVRSVEGIWKSVVEPVLLIEKSVLVAKDAVEEPMAKSVVPEYVEEAAAMENLANGLVVPMPTFPLVAKKIDEVAVMVLVPLKYGSCPWVPEYSEEVAMARVGAEPSTDQVPPTVRPRPKEGAASSGWPAASRWRAAICSGRLIRCVTAATARAAGWPWPG